MNIQISEEAQKHIRNKFNGNLYLTYRQYTFNCMCGQLGEFVKADNTEYLDHKYETYTYHDVTVNIDQQFILYGNKVMIDIDENKELKATGFELYDRTKLYNL